MFQNIQRSIYLITTAQVLLMTNSLKPTILGSASMGLIKSIYSCDFISTNAYLEYNNIPLTFLMKMEIFSTAVFTMSRKMSHSLSHQKLKLSVANLEVLLDGVKLTS